MRTSELSGKALEALIAQALGDPPGSQYLTRWPDMDQVLERFAIQVAPMAGKNWIWCAVVVGKPGTGIEAGPWIEGQTIRIAVGRAIVAARYGREIPDPP
ncbi:hypothetical protein [Xenophilus sp. Marseille-Q4582]|uniref:hypothetical protein n=1 Tax=Xenophilus sp. Marseille-Q4582 TaxID=2866600 RepID=UPI001CE3DCFD|nr:hypothetical protein [Xenophilus sp. Marseille-Q4582]